MLSSETARASRVRVTTAGEYVEAAAKRGDRGRSDERYMRGFDFALSGLCHHGHIIFPYSGQDDEVVLLNREQAEHLAATLLRKLAPGGELPTDAAELLDFVAPLLRNA